MAALVRGFNQLSNGNDGSLACASTNRLVVPPVVSTVEEVAVPLGITIDPANIFLMLDKNITPGKNVTNCSHYFSKSPTSQRLRM